MEHLESVGRDGVDASEWSGDGAVRAAHGSYRPTGDLRQDRDFSLKVRGLRRRLEESAQRIARLRQELRELDRGQPEYDRGLSRLHALERSLFSQRLELDEIFKARRRVTAGLHPHAAGQRPTVPLR